MVEYRRRKWLAMACGLCVLPRWSRTQSQERLVRVGWLGWTGGAGATASPVPLAAFRAGLADRGWHEGRNLALVVRAGDGSGARALTAELLATQVDVIVAQGPMVFGARAVAGTVPLVFNINGDPVEAKLVASLAHPGANVTGVTALSEELAGKRLELLKAIVPGLVRVAAIANQAHPGVQTEHHASHAAAQKLGLQLQWFPIHSAAELDKAFDAIARDKPGALVAIPDNLINQRAQAIGAFALRQRAPSISGWAEFAEAGNMLSYGPDLRAYYRRIAVYVDKLLRGARPADLPVEQPSEFEFVVNLRAAKALGVTVPTAVLVRANRTIA